MLKNLPYWGKLVLVLALSAAVILIAWRFYPNFSEMNKDINDMQAKLEKKQQEIKKGQAIEAKLPEFEREIANLEEKLGYLRQILPTEPETGDLLKDIKSLADRANLELKLFDPESFKQQEFYKEFPIKMEIIGGYHDLGIFFDQIGKYSRIVNITNVLINAVWGGSVKTIKSSFIATTFIYIEESEKEKKEIKK
ncbi:MAG: type 4a pilus biogenesis protein PilO [Acidobacteriota bacterium]